MRAKNFMLAASAALGVAVLLSPNAKAVSLDTLIAAGPDNMIVVGNVVYSNFTYGGTLPSSVAINATATGLAFTRTGGFTNPNDSYVIQYDMTVTDSNVTGVGLDFSATASGGDVADVAESVQDLSTGQVYNLPLVHTDGPGGNPDVLSSTLSLSPAATQLHMVKSIDVTGSGAAITLVDNTFTLGGGTSAPPPIPEPMSLALLPLALVGLGLRKRLAR